MTKKQKTILVTGGCGYIGSHTIVELLTTGYQVISIDNFSNSFPEVQTLITKIAKKSFVNINIDLAKNNAPSLLIKKLQKMNIPVIHGVIHFAAYKAVGESMLFPQKYYQNNLNSMVNILEFCRQLKIKNFIFSSSCTVYGQPKKFPVSENTPLAKASSIYGHTKQMCEEISNMYTQVCSGLKVVALRYFNPIGSHTSGKLGELPNNPPQALLPIIVEVVQGKRDKLTVFGDNYNTRDGTCVRDYLHVSDLAMAHVLALQYLENNDVKEKFIPINLGTGKGITVKELINAYEKFNNVKVIHEIGERRSGDIEAIYANIKKAKRLLGWECQHSIKDMVQSAHSWAKYYEYK